MAEEIALNLIERTYFDGREVEAQYKKGIGERRRVFADIGLAEKLLKTIDEVLAKS